MAELENSRDLIGVLWSGADILRSKMDELDHLITLHQRECEKLKDIKKFMLQNMFV